MRCPVFTHRPQPHRLPSPRPPPRSPHRPTRSADPHKTPTRTTPTTPRYTRATTTKVINFSLTNRPTQRIIPHQGTMGGTFSTTSITSPSLAHPARPLSHAPPPPQSRTPTPTPHFKSNPLQSQPLHPIPYHHLPKLPKISHSHRSLSASPYACFPLSALLRALRAFAVASSSLRPFSASPRFAFHPFPNEPHHNPIHSIPDTPVPLSLDFSRRSTTLARLRVFHTHRSTQ